MSAALIISTAGLSACSDSGSSSKSGGDKAPINPINKAPVADQLVIDLDGGNAWVGNTATANYHYSDAENDLQGSSVYRWLRDGTAIANAAEQAYLLTAEDAGKAITFEITPIAVSGEKQGAAITSPAVNVVTQSAPSATNVMINTFADQPWVGTELIGSYDYQDNEADEEGETSLRWLADGIEVASATSKYTLQASDNNKSLTFQVTPKAKTGRLNGAAHTSAAVIVKSNSFPQATDLTISVVGGGTAATGRQLNAEYTYNDADNDIEYGSQYRWLRNGVAITNAVQQRYTLEKIDAGKSITFEVIPETTTGQSPGPALISAGTDINALPILTNATFQVSAAYPGESLSIRYSYNDREDDQNGIHKFTWYRDGVVIPGVTWSYYSLKLEDAGTIITAKVIPIAKTGSLEGFEIDVLSPVTVNNNTPPVASNVLISDSNGGAVNPGDTLTASYDYSDADGDAEGDTTIVWQYAKGNTSGYIGQSGDTYVVSSNYLNGKVWAIVIPKAKTGATIGANAYSDRLDVVAPDTTAPLLTEQSPVTTPTFNKVVQYTFHTNEAGSLNITGDCSAPLSSVSAGTYTITFAPLSVGTHNNCTLKITDISGNESLPLNISTFEIQQLAPMKLTLLINDNYTLINSDDGDDLDIMISSKESCSFFEPNQCAQAEFFNTATKTITGRLSKTASGYLRIKKEGNESSNKYISSDKFAGSIYHKVSHYNNSFWLVTNHVSGLQNEGIYTSQDGIDWQAVTVPSAVNFGAGRGHSQIVFQDKLHLMLGSKHIIYDANAEPDAQWTSNSTPTNIAFSWYNTAYTFNNKLYVLAGFNSSKLFVYDGNTWTKVTDEVTIDNEVATISGGDFDVVELSGTLYMFAFAEDNNRQDIFSSNNGINWQRVTTTGDAFPTDWTSIANVEAVKLQGNIVLTFYDSKGTGHGRQTVFKSNNGIQWYQVEQGHQLKYDIGQEQVVANNKLYAFGGGNLINSVATNDSWVSNDGINFDPIHNYGVSPSMNKHKTIVFNDRLWGFSMKGSSLEIFNTDDGTQWHKVATTLNTSVVNPSRGFEIYSWGTELFVMGGFGSGKIYSSVNGINWHFASNFTSDVTGAAPEVINNGDHLLKVGDSSDKRSYTSTDGTSWTASNAVESNIASQLFNHQLVKTDGGTLMSIGGKVRPGHPQPEATLADVYSSDNNGATWQLNSAAELPEAMDGHQAINFKGKIWLFNKNKVYSFNENTSQWIDRGTTPNSAYAIDHQVVEFKNRLWMTGGSRNPEQLYVSEDAVNWYQAKTVTIEFP